MVICQCDLYSQFDGHLGSFQFREVMNKAVVKILVQVFVRTYAFPSLLGKSWEWNG